MIEDNCENNEFSENVDNTEKYAKNIDTLEKIDNADNINNNESIANDNFDENSNKKNSKSSTVLIVILSVLIACMICLIVYKVNYINIEVSGESMCPTLKDGELLVAKKNSDVDRGDIIIVNIDNKKMSDGSDYWLIKRAIAIAGDTVKIEDGKVWLKKAGESDFSILEEDYTQGNTNTNDSNAVVKEWIVGDNQVFFLGDNRENSLDGRYYGVKDLSDVIGVVQTWSVEKEGFQYTFNKIVNYPSKLFASCRNKIGVDN